MKASKNNHNSCSDSHECRQKRYHGNDIVWYIFNTIISRETARCREYFLQFHRIGSGSYKGIRDGKNTAIKSICEVSEKVFGLHICNIATLSIQMQKKLQKKHFLIHSGGPKKNYANYYSHLSSYFDSSRPPPGTRRWPQCSSIKHSPSSYRTSWSSQDAPYWNNSYFDCIHR